MVITRVNFFLRNVHSIRIFLDHSDGLETMLNVFFVDVILVYVYRCIQNLSCHKEYTMIHYVNKKKHVNYLCASTAVRHFSTSDELYLCGVCRVALYLFN